MSAFINETQAHRKYWLKGLLIGIGLSLLLIVLYVIRNLIELKGDCGLDFFPFFGGGGSQPCTLLDYYFFGMIFANFFLIIFWWLVVIVFIIPLVTGIILDNYSFQIKAKSVIIVVSLLLLFIIIFVVFTAPGKHLESQVAPKPSEFVPTKCIMPPFGITCMNFEAHPTYISISFQNDIGHDIKLNSIDIGGCSSAYDGMQLANGENKVFRVGGSCNIGKPNDKFTEEITITYQDMAAGLERKIIGSIAGKVVP